MAAFSFPSSRSKRLLIALLAVILCAVLIILIPILTDPYDCRIVEDVRVGGLDLGGLTKKEARNTLQEALDRQLLGQTLTISLPEETITLTAQEFIADADVKSAVRDAYRYGRADAPGSKEIGLLSYLTLNEAVIREALETYAGKYDTILTETVCQLEGPAPELSTDGFDPAAAPQTLTVTLGTPHLQLDVDGVYDEILARCDQILGPEGSLAIEHNLEPEAIPESLSVDAVWAEFCTDAVSDSLDLETYQFVHGSYGYGFDRNTLQEQLDNAQYGQTITVPMTYTDPEILGDQVYFREILGQCETRHTNDINRNTNLSLLCQFLNGVILQPGEEFSYNGTIGERTPERGFKPANAYSGTRVVQDYGGGVCQGSTTLYNCALLADLEILERVCHGATVGYVPLGLDAAVNWNTKTDLRFRNNFHFPIMLQAELSDGYVKMKILGTDEKDYYIEMKSSSSSEGEAVYAVSYKCKYSKETGELLSKDLEARSSYYPLS